MKKLLTLTALVSLSFTLAACGNKEPELPNVDDIVNSGDALIQETIDEVQGLIDEVENLSNEEITIIGDDLQQTEGQVEALSGAEQGLEDATTPTEVIEPTPESNPENTEEGSLNPEIIIETIE